MAMISNVIKEGKKVKWTPVDKLVKLTVFALIVVFLYSIFFMISDYIVLQFIRLIVSIG